MRYYLALKADAGSVPCSTTNLMRAGCCQFMRVPKGPMSPRFSGFLESFRCYPVGTENLE